MLWQHQGRGANIWIRQCITVPNCLTFWAHFLQIVLVLLQEKKKEKDKNHQLKTKHERCGLSHCFGTGVSRLTSPAEIQICRMCTSLLGVQYGTPVDTMKGKIICWLNIQSFKGTLGNHCGCTYQVWNFVLRRLNLRFIKEPNSSFTTLYART